MIFVVEYAGERIVEHRARLVEAHAVLPKIRARLPAVPFEAKTHAFNALPNWPNGGATGQDTGPYGLTAATAGADHATRLTLNYYHPTSRCFQAIGVHFRIVMQLRRTLGDP
jgi:hypothetical protein